MPKELTPGEWAALLGISAIVGLLSNLAFGIWGVALCLPLTLLWTAAFYALRPIWWGRGRE